MKRFLAVAALTVSALATSATAGTGLSNTVNVPFEFKVQNTVMPAGKYKVRPQSANLVMLENVQTGQRFNVIREGGYDGARGHKLRFHSNGEIQVLDRVG